MSNTRFSDSKVLIVATQVASRDIVKDTLHNMGFRGTRVCQDLIEAKAILDVSFYDLLIIDCDFTEGDPSDLILDLRQNREGAISFIPVIALTWQPVMVTIKKMVDAGADLVLSLPMPAQKMLDAIRTIIDNRKPFVVTSGYVGPDRRGVVREDDDNSVMRVEVPNTLRKKATGKDDGIDAAKVLEVVRDKRVESHASKVLHTVGLITQAAAAFEEDGGESLRNFVDELREVVVDLDRRIAKTRHAHQATLCKSLVDVANRMAADGSEKGITNSRDLALVQQLGMAVELAMKQSDGASAGAAMDISDVVAQRDQQGTRQP